MTIRAFTATEGRGRHAQTGTYQVGKPDPVNGHTIVSIDEEDHDLVVNYKPPPYATAHNKTIPRDRVHRHSIVRD